jgi:hypothetical protein
MVNNKNRVQTSVRVDPVLFDEFKIESLKQKFSIQKLVDRCMHLYITSAEFRKTINNHNNIAITGSI